MVKLMADSKQLDKLPVVCDFEHIDCCFASCSVNFNSLSVSDGVRSGVAHKYRRGRSGLVGPISRDSSPSFNSSFDSLELGKWVGVSSFLIKLISMIGYVL